MKIKNIMITLLILCCSCSSAARLQMKDGSVTEGKVLRSTADEIVIKTGDDSAQIVERKNIEDIDHPGNVALVTGTALAATGLATVAAGLIAFGVGDDQRAEQADALKGSSFPIIWADAGFSADVVGVMLVGGGIGLLAASISPIIWGTYTWTDSNARIDNPGIDKVEISIGNGMGLSLKASF